MNQAEQINILADNMLRLYPKEEIEAAIGLTGYEKYQDDPVGFVEKVLHEKLTPDTEKLMESVRDYTTTIARSANATGKALPVNTLIPTPTGNIKIGELNVGDYVFGKSGEPTRVIGVYPQGIQPTYEILFNDQTKILCSEDHLWTIRSSSQKSRGADWVTLPLKDIIPIAHRHIHIPMCDPVAYPKQEFKIDPYVMGVLIGDGSLTNTVCFDSPDKFIVDELRKRIPDANVVHYSKIAYGISTALGQPNPILNEIRTCGLYGKKSNKKFIPIKYLFGSIEQRKLLLQGLMDTDGYIEAAGSMSYCTTSKQLAKDITTLIHSLGGTGKVFTKKPFFTYKGERKEGLLAYNINIKIPFCPFRLHKKKKRYIPEEYLQKQAQRIIENITKVDDRDSVCIKVEAKDSLFLAGDYVVTHNTFVAARIASWFYKCFPECQVWTAAAPPEDNLKKLMWGEIGNIIHKHEGLFKADTQKDLHVQRTPLQFLTGVTIPSSGTNAQRVAKFSGKHSPVLVFILDEGDAIPDAVYEGIESCMSGGTIVRLLIMFNPRHESGEVWRKEKSGLANVVELSAFNHPNVMTGENQIQGAVTREVTIQRINEWCSHVPQSKEEEIDGTETDIFKLPDFLNGVVAEKKMKGQFYDALMPGYYKIVNPVFSYMVLGKYPSAGANQLISREWIDNARSRWDAHVVKFGETPTRGTTCIMGQDVAEEGSDSNTSCFRWGGFVERFIDWSKIDLNESGDRASEEYHARTGLASGIRHCAVDATGIGAGIAPHMRRLGCNSYGIKVAEKPDKVVEEGQFGILRDQLMWSVREWLRVDTGSMLPPDDELIEELMCPTWKTVGKYVKVMSKNGKDGMRELLKRSPDKFDALALTFSPVKIKKRITSKKVKRSNYVWS